MVRGKKIRYRKWLILAFSLLVFLALAQKLYNRYIEKNADTVLDTVDRTWLNYSAEVLETAKALGLPPDYLLALIALECSGYKQITPRYEPYIFKQLTRLREGTIEQFEGITPEDVLRSDDAALKNLASSWGPFQIMGYQCLHLDIKIKQLRGKNAIYHGALWIQKAYGTYLDKKRFKDAFHLHNTGQKYPVAGPPRTHNRKYVPRGLKYMKTFAGKIEGLRKQETMEP